MASPRETGITQLILGTQPFDLKISHWPLLLKVSIAFHIVSQGTKLPRCEPFFFGGGHTQTTVSLLKNVIEHSLISIKECSFVVTMEILNLFLV